MYSKYVKRKKQQQRSSELVVSSEESTMNNVCLAFQALKWRKFEENQKQNEMSSVKKQQLWAF